MESSEYWIEKLNLEKHPEGGYFRETYRSAVKITEDCLPQGFSGSRDFSTSIFYLLPGNEFSSFHRIKSDEIWHFYYGSPMTLHVIGKEGNYSIIHLGEDFEKGQSFQAIINSGDWFGASVDNSVLYSLVGCTVSPGFDFKDFEIGSRDELISKYPQHRSIIMRLTG